VAQRPDNLIKALQQSICDNHACEAVYIQSVRVEEPYADDKLWTGQVEIFKILGHAKAQIAYGWWQEDSETGLITILALTPTMEARKAVQAYLMSQDEKN
jgi:hypothetical protein